MAVRPDNWPHAPLQDGGNCLLVPLDDPPALAEAICGLVDDRDRARRIGEAGRAYVYEHFDFGAVGDRYLELLASCLPKQ
jgi:colanic acid biosynthesis glycosyl transferase WcaI